MKIKKILSRCSLSDSEDKECRRQRSVRMKSLLDEDAGVVFWEDFCDQNDWPKMPTIANIRRYKEVFVNVKEKEINCERQLSTKGGKVYISGHHLFIKPVHRLRAQLLSAQNVAAKPVTIAHVAPAPNKSSHGNIHANETSRASTCAVNSNNKRPMPELDTDSEDSAEDGFRASLTGSAPLRPLRSSYGILTPPSAIMVNPLRQETTLPIHTPGNTDVVAGPNDTSRSVGSTFNAGALDDKYPQFKAREFKLGLSQSPDKKIGSYQHRICKTIKTVPEVLQEWRYGQPDQPAIQTLNNTFKATWRHSADKTIYGARCYVVNAYTHLVTREGLSNTEAIEFLEQERGTNTIVTLCKKLKKAALKTKKGTKSSVYGKDEPEYPKDLMNQAGRAPKPPLIEDTEFPLPVRHINSIPNIWKEWEDGWEGEPSIRSLILLRGRAWNNPKFKRYENHFRYRNQLVRTIREAATKHAVKSHDDAIQVLEDLRGAREPSTLCKSEAFRLFLKNKWGITTAVKEYWKCGKYQINE